MAEILAVPVIFRKITELKPEIPEAIRWSIANKIKEASTTYRNSPSMLADRFTAIAAAADILDANELPVTVGNLQEQAFTTALQAFNWLQRKHQQVRVTAEEVRTFVGRMGISHNRFRRVGINSSLCQGSVLDVLVEGGQLSDLADHLASSAEVLD